MDEQQIVQLVKRYLQPLQASMGIEVVDKSVRQDGNWWYISVRGAWAARTYRYYEELTDVESEIHDHENINVLLVPSG